MNNNNYNVDSTTFQKELNRLFLLDKKGENSSYNEEGSCQANNINGIVPQKIIDKVLHTKYLYDHGNHNKHIEDPHIDACFITRNRGS